MLYDKTCNRHSDKPVTVNVNFLILNWTWVMLNPWFGEIHTSILGQKGMMSATDSKMAQRKVSRVRVHTRVVREGERERLDKAMWEKNITRECDQRVLRRTLYYCHFFFKSKVHQNKHFLKIRGEKKPTTRETFPSSAEWEKRVTAGTYHSKLISVQVPILVDVTEVPDLKGKESKAYWGRKNTC